MTSVLISFPRRSKISGEDDDDDDDDIIQPQVVLLHTPLPSVIVLTLDACFCGSMLCKSTLPLQKDNFKWWFYIQPKAVWEALFRPNNTTKACADFLSSTLEYNLHAREDRLHEQTAVKLPLLQWYQLIVMTFVQ